MTADYSEIAKDPASLKTPPNFADYSTLATGWTWEGVKSELDLPGGSYNLAHECIDRHANGLLATKVAMIHEGQDGTVTNFTFADMQREANRWANALASLGIRKADRIFFFTDRIPELYFAIFGTLKLGAIIAPLFSAFGPEPVAERIRRAEGVMVVTTPHL
ncbi:MAG: AMP-binding protein, partial [Dehalococcoidia bacterium]